MKKFFLPFFALSILFLSCQISTTSNAEYTVSFDTVGGSDIESQTVLAGDYAEEPSEPAKADAVFVGWVNSKDQTFDFETTKIYKNTTVYAKWRDLDQITGLTGAASNSGTNASTAFALLDNQNYELEYDQVVYLILQEELEGAVIYYTVDGTEPTTDSSVYTAAGIVPFYGENKEETFTVKAYASCDGYKDGAVFTCSCTLKKYSVTVDKDDGSESKDYTLYSGEKLNDGTAFEAPSKTDYTFKGWFVGSTEFDFTKVVAYTDAAFTVKALWTENGTLATPTFSISGTDVDSGEEVELGINSSDSLADCTIYYTTDGTIPTTSSLVYSDAIVITDDTTVMAFVHSNDGSLKDSSVITEVFTLKRYTVTFDSVEGSDVDSQTVKSGSKATKPEDPTKTNNEFNYWYLEDSEVEYDFDTEVMSDIKLVAKWTSTEDKTPPNAVSNLKVDGIGSITVSWDNPEDEDFAGVIVKIYDDEGNLIKSEELDSSETSYVYSPSTEGNYLVEVIAKDTSGNENASDSVSVKYYQVQYGSYNIVEGDTDYPYFITLFTEKLYIHTTSQELNVWLPVAVSDNFKGTSYATWYVKKNSGSWETATTTNVDSFETRYETGNGKVLMMRFKASAFSSGDVYNFMVILSSEMGSTVTSNVCTVEYGTTNAQKIGQYYYSDNTYSSNYDSSKTLLGIVTDLDTSGNPSKIIATQDASNGTPMWAPVDTTGYNKQFVTTIDDGLMNWNVITSGDPNGAGDAATYYPAFNACNNYTAGDLTWYLPASAEMLQVCANRQVINACSGFETIQEAQYWTSSDIGGGHACMFNFKDCFFNGNVKNSPSNLVRAIAKIK